MCVPRVCGCPKRPEEGILGFPWLQAQELRQAGLCVSREKNLTYWKNKKNPQAMGPFSSLAMENLNEMGKRKNDKFYMFSLICESYNSLYTKDTQTI